MSEQNYTSGTSYTVQSSAFLRADFGQIDMPSMSGMNAILIEFRGGAEYIYLGVPDALYNTLQQLCQEHVRTEGRLRVGSVFSRSLFNVFPCYARLHQPNIDV